MLLLTSEPPCCREFAHANRDQMAAIYGIPVLIVAKGRATATAAEPLSVLCEWDWTADAFGLALPEQLARVRPAKKERARGLQLMLTGCDFVTNAAQWAGVTLSPALLLGNAHLALDTLMRLHRSDMEAHLLRDCHVRLTVGRVPQSIVWRELFTTSDGLKCADVSIAMALDQPWMPRCAGNARLCRACVLCILWLTCATL